ncbi:sugar ABC transporter substrate-binding protein [uncultured Jatrophihabitans sp.]|uniref:sugar ABC transporter substrate-binding protein n=1 Tax=uncultured Jatrophihabitans sp. TaxID=1610747 RepID=UPI0035C9EB15
MLQQFRQHRPGAKMAVVVAAVALTVTACSSSGGGGKTTSPTADSSATTSSGAATSDTGAPASGGATSLAAMQADLAKFTGEVTSTAALKPVTGVSKLKGKTVWYIPIGSAVPILNAFGVGMKGALDKLGIKLQVCDGKFLPTTMASCINQAATQGADGVVTGYIDYQLVPTAFDNLVAHKIPVLIAGEAPDGGKTNSPALAFDDTSPTINALQRLMNESVIVDSKGKAKVLFLGVTDSPQLKGAAAYSKKFYADNCPGCTFTEIDYNTASLNKLPSQVSSALIAHPDTTYVVAEVDAAGAGAVSGIETAGFSNKVKFASTNGALDALQRIKNGAGQFVDVGTGGIYLGWQFVDGIVRMMTGVLPVNGFGVVRVFTKENIANLTLTPAAYATNAWYGSDAFEKTFLTAWGVS